MTILSEQGVPLICETNGCGTPATSVWSGGWNSKPRRSCHQHNPMHNVAMAMPVNFTSQPLCHACGQPINVGALIHGG
jgi:hypothetical protein